MASEASSSVRWPISLLAIPPLPDAAATEEKRKLYPECSPYRRATLESQQAIAKRTSALLKGTPANQMAGHASSFYDLGGPNGYPRRAHRAGIAGDGIYPASLGARFARLLSSKYEIEFVDLVPRPLTSAPCPTTQALRRRCWWLVRLSECARPSNGTRKYSSISGERPTRKQTPLALVRTVSAAASRPTFCGRTARRWVAAHLMVGGEQWGEIVDGPVGEEPWTAARWRRALTSQFAAALERGELWNDDGTQVAGHVPVTVMREVCNVGPQHRRIRGSLGEFDAFHGWNEEAQFPAIWSHKESTHQSMSSYPNAHLVPKPESDYVPIWAQSGTLQITPDVQYDSQRIISTRTVTRALGVRAWHSLNVHESDPLIKTRMETALALWCNSTLGMLLHANHANRAQRGRGTGNKGMLESLFTVDVRNLKAWQLDEAQTIWRDFVYQKLQSFHQCAIDPVRIQLDERIVRDLLGLGEDAVASVARLRTLLASDPSIHGSKKPELPS